MRSARRRALTYWLRAGVDGRRCSAIVFLPAAQPARRGDPGDPRQRGGGGVGRRARHERQAARVRARRLRRGAGRRAVAGDRAHLPAEGLFQRPVDGLHDLHGAGRRHRHLRGRRSSARVIFFADRDLVRRHGRLVPGRPRRDGAALRAAPAARHLGRDRGPLRRCSLLPVGYRLRFRAPEGATRERRLQQTASNEGGSA